MAQMIDGRGRMPTVVFHEIRSLFDIKNPAGYTREAINRAKDSVGGMPPLLEQFYLQYGLSDELRRLQDSVILPDKYPIFHDCDYLIFFNENQGVCQAGIHKSDLHLSDPPVCVGYDNAEWVRSADTLSGFLVAMFGYQAALCLEYSPQCFYWVTDEETAQIAALFPRRKESLMNWLNCEIELYGANDSARIALMRTGDDTQMFYAANNRSDFESIKSALKNIGEVI
jgi:hypothetical protein